MRWSETIVWWSVLLFIFLLPFFFIPASWMSIAASKMLLAIVLITIAALASALSSLSEGIVRIPKSYLLAAAALVPIAYIVSAIATGSSRDSFIGNGEQDTVVAIVLLYALFLVSANVLAAHKSRIALCIRALLIGTALVIALQFLHLLAPTLTLGGAIAGTAASVVGSWHDLGLFLGLMLFSSLALLNTRFGGEGRWRGVCIGVAIAVAALLIVVNYSDVWIAVAALALLYAAYIWRNKDRTDLYELSIANRRILWWIILAITAAGLFWGGALIQSHLPAKLQVSQLEVRPSWIGTWLVGQHLFTTPGSVFFGTGPNTFPRDWGLYKPVSVNTTQFWNVDFNVGVGFIPTSAVTVGFFGLIAWAAVIVALLFALWRAFFAPRERRSHMGFLITGGAVYLTAFHILYIPGPALSILTFLFFGLLAAQEITEGAISDFVVPLSLETWRGRIGALLLVACSLAIAYAGVQGARAILSDALVNRAAVQYQASADATAASRSLSLALAINEQSDRAHRAAVELGMIQLSSLAGAKDETAQALLKDTLQTTIHHGLTAVSIENRDYQNWLTLAYLYGQLAGVGVEGAAANARDAYAQAQKDNPTNPLPLLGLAQLDLLKKDDAAAAQELKAALALKSDLAAAHYLLSQIDARANDFENARSEATTAVQLVPSDPLGWYNLGTIFYAGGDYQNAAAALQRAVGLQNNYSNALFLLGLSKYRLGQTTDALFAFEAVASLNPDDASLASIVTSFQAGKDPFATSSPARKP